VDSIGVLNQIYGAADLAYVGGAFDSGLHNILEATAFGVPVIFGPNYSRFTDAKVMIDEGLAFSVSDSEGLKNTLSLLLAQTNKKEALLAFMTKRTGAKKSILAYLETTLSK
jgi:3-deoxy-D-manno-octulosonic-acid transferase